MNCAADDRPLKLERIPMELLILLLEKNGQVVTRQEIIERLWGKDLFLDTEHGINTAIRKIGTALREDVERPRLIQTVSGKGYRFVADEVSTNANGAAASAKIVVSGNPIPENPVAESRLQRIQPNAGGCGETGPIRSGESLASESGPGRRLLCSW